MSPLHHVAWQSWKFRFTDARRHRLRYLRWVDFVFACVKRKRSTPRTGEFSRRALPDLGRGGFSGCCARSPTG